MYEDDLSRRVAQLERRVAELEGPARRQPAAPASGEGPLFALEQLKERLLPHAGEAGVGLFTGSVGLPTGERYEWQEAHPVEGLLEQDWREFADPLSALAHPVRLLLLQQVLSGVRTVAEMSAHESLGTSGQLYHHLRQLTAAGWLRATGRGRYAVPGERVVPLLIVLMGVRR